MFLLLDVPIAPEVESLFDDIRHHFDIILQNVIKAIVEKSKLEDVKGCLALVCPELEVEFRAVDSDRDLISLVQRNCFFTNIHLLESLAERSAKNSHEVWRLFTTFEEARDELYEQVLARDFVKEAKERVRASHAKVMFVCHGSYF